MTTTHKKPGHTALTLTPSPADAGEGGEPNARARMSRTIEANAQNLYHVTRADLPLSCPMPGMSLWNSHPRVYLPIESTGQERCPYCGAVYVLQERAAK